MDYGFGSVFGSSTGSTASSQAVQKSLETMMSDLYDQGYDSVAASKIAMDKMYPGYLNYSQGLGSTPVNFMDMNVGNPLPGHHKNYMNSMDSFGHNNSLVVTTAVVMVVAVATGGGGGGGGGDSSGWTPPSTFRGMPQGNPNERFGGMAALQTEYD